MSEILIHKRVPQEWSGSLKIMYRPDTAENPEQANIQGVGIILFKINNPIRICQLRQKTGVNIW